MKKILAFIPAILIVISCSKDIPESISGREGWVNPNKYTLEEATGVLLNTLSMMDGPKATRLGSGRRISGSHVAGAGKTSVTRSAKPINLDSLST